MVTSTLLLQFLPLIGAIFVLLIPKKKIILAGTITLIFALVELIYTAISLQNSIQFEWSIALGVILSFNFDKLAALTLIVISGATVIATLYSLKVKQTPELTSTFYSLVLFVLFGTTGVALASDLIQFYVFWEAMLIPAWLMVLHWNEEPNRAVYISLKFFIITHIGAVLMLASILWIYSISKMTNMSSLAAYLPTLSSNILIPMIVLFLMGFIVKLAIFPFHTWLPDTYTSSVMPLTLILVGVMTNIGIYGLARFITFFPMSAIAPISTVLLIAAVVTMFYGGFMALVEKNIKRILAYSSISQMGYVLLGFATLLPLGLSGSIFNLYNQAATKLTLFICIGTVASYAGTYRIDELGGWGKRLPYTAVFATGAMLSLIGAPPVLGFWPEFLTFSAGFGTGQYVIAFLALAASAISAAYGLRLIRLTFFGALKEQSEGETLYPHWTVTLSVLSCFIILILLGVFPGLIFDLVRQSLAQLGIMFGG